VKEIFTFSGAGISIFGDFLAISRLENPPKQFSGWVWKPGKEN